MTAIDIYTKSQVDALIAGAGGGLERLSVSNWGQILTGSSGNYLVELCINKQVFFIYTCPDDANTGQVDHKIVYLDTTPSHVIMSYDIPITLSTLIPACQAAGHDAAVNISATPLKAVINNTDVEWTIDSSLIPYNFAVTIDPTDYPPYADRNSYIRVFKI